MTRQCWSPGEDRPHSVYRYTDQIYKVVQWKRVMLHLGPGPAAEQQHHDHKLEQSLSRTRRVILEKALCNPWDWFCTFTISEDNFDRTDLKTWHAKFAQWLRDQRKKGYDIRYLLVPEKHKKGTWHCHGLISGIPESELISFAEMDKQGYRSANGKRLPKSLRLSNYRNWPAYQNKFGFCSLGKIKNPVAASFYVSKYITKEQDRMVQDVGLHSYYASRNLQGATKHVDFFGRDPGIDRLLVNKYEWCSTGMTHVKDHCDWSFCQEFVNITDLEPLEFDSCEDEEFASAESEADEYYDFEQTVLKI